MDELFDLWVVFKFGFGFLLLLCGCVCVFLCLFLFSWASLISVSMVFACFIMFVALCGRSWYILMD